jgi:hypothetical protein
MIIGANAEIEMVTGVTEITMAVEVVIEMTITTTAIGRITGAPGSGGLIAGLSGPAGTGGIRIIGDFNDQEGIDGGSWLQSWLRVLVISKP